MSQICSKMANFLFSAYFGGHFVTIETVKVKSKPVFYTSAIALINYLKLLNSIILIFWPQRGAKIASLCMYSFRKGFAKFMIPIACLRSF